MVVPVSAGYEFLSFREGAVFAAIKTSPMDGRKHNHMRIVGLGKELKSDFSKSQLENRPHTLSNELHSGLLPPALSTSG